jgi:hypothetical protein
MKATFTRPPGLDSGAWKMDRSMPGRRTGASLQVVSLMNRETGSDTARNSTGRLCQSTPSGMEEKR